MKEGKPYKYQGPDGIFVAEILMQVDVANGVWFNYHALKPEIIQLAIEAVMKKDRQFAKVVLMAAANDIKRVKQHNENSMKVITDFKNQ